MSLLYVKNQSLVIDLFLYYLRLSSLIKIFEGNFIVYIPLLFLNSIIVPSGALILNSSPFST